MNINNTIVTTYMARVGNALAVQGQIENAMLRGGRAAATQTRQMGLLTQQMRAFGTTVRYALAGGVVFGLTSLVGKLNQLQQQLGLIQAIAPTAGVNLNQQNIGGFLQQIEERAVSARTPVSDLNNAVINFLSTVQNAKQSDIPDIVARIGQTARLSQTPTEDLTKAITTLNIAAGRPNNLKTTNALLREWFHLISQAPGGIAAAPQIAQQLGPLAAVARIPGARLTPEQIFGFSLGALRFGATPSTALRGAQYAIQSILTPTGAHAKALAAAGFTPRRLQAEGGARFIYDYLQYLKTLGARGASTKALRQFGQRVDLDPDTEAALQPNETIPGMSPQATAFLTKTIGRIHGIRTIAVWLAQLERTGQVGSLADVVTAFDKLNRGVGKDANELDKAIKRYNQATPLQGAAIALDTLRVQISKDLEPLLNPVSRKVMGAAGFLQRHPDETKAGVLAGAGALGIYGLTRLFGGRGIGGLLRRGPGGLVAGQAISDLAHPSTQLGDSPTNPMYVIVVGQLFGPGGVMSRGNWKKPGGGWAGGAGTAREAEEAAKNASRLGKIATYGKFAGLSAATAYFGSQGLVAIMESLGAKFGPAPQNFPKGAESLGGGIFTNPRAGTFWRQRRPGERIGNRISFLEAFGDMSDENKKKFSPLYQKLAKQTLDETNASLAGVFNTITKAVGIAGPKGAQQVAGGVDLNIKITDPSGKTKDARVHIPLSAIHEGGRHPVSRGKRKSMRVDFSVGGANYGQAVHSRGGNE